MFTQCLKCETVFRVSAGSLRVAGGQVRCGRCGEVFDALARLADDSAGFTVGDSPVELEARADEILENSSSRPQQAQTVDAPPGTQLAELQFIEPFDGNERVPQPRAQSREQPRRMAEFAAWSAAAVVLGVLLLTQAARGNREWLSVHLPPWLGNTAATPEATLASYQLRQSDASGEHAVKGTLRVRAAIVNIAARPQPCPLLRVTLMDRFGTPIGARDFAASDYLGGAMARMLAPGERADITLDILDPREGGEGSENGGVDNEGVEMDVCLRRNDKSVVCAADIASRTR